MWKNIFLLFICVSAHAQTKPCEEKIFKVCSDQVAAFAKELNNSEGKYLVVGFGADWCPWCVSLHKLLDEAKLPRIDIGLYQDKEKVKSGYAVLDQVKAMAGNPKLPAGIPLLAVINTKSKRAAFIDTEPLEKNTKTSKGHDPLKLAAAIKRAEKTLE